MFSATCTFLTHMCRPVFGAVCFFSAPAFKDWSQIVSPSPNTPSSFTGWWSEKKGNELKRTAGWTGGLGLGKVYASSLEITASAAQILALDGLHRHTLLDLTSTIFFIHIMNRGLKKLLRTHTDRGVWCRHSHPYNCKENDRDLLYMKSALTWPLLWSGAVEIKLNWLELNRMLLWSPVLYDGCWSGAWRSLKCLSLKCRQCVVWDLETNFKRSLFTVDCKFNKSVNVI